MCGKMSIQLGRWKLALACAVVFSTAIAANAQSSGDTGAGPDSGQASIPTLEEVRALPPELDVVDLYRRNPIQLAPNMFDRSWSPPPTVEEVSLQGGYIYLAINYGLYQAGQGLKHLTGARDHVQHAFARPAPLTEAQLRRAAAHYEAGDQADRPSPP